MKAQWVDHRYGSGATLYVGPLSASVDYTHRKYRARCPGFKDTEHETFDEAKAACTRRLKKLVSNALAALETLCP